MPKASTSASLQLIVELFEQQFFAQYNTQLIGGANEPIYLPADGDCPRHRLFFREDFLSSALHETAHWCIAGSDRLVLEDFGYWYNPDGRTAEQQHIFEAAEVKPQALEWMFSVACGQGFALSVDNLSGGNTKASESFALAVSQQAIAWCQLSQLPDRAALFINALSELFDRPNTLNPEYYQIGHLTYALLN
jgi:elongation factor P hydroxylase